MKIENTSIVDVKVLSPKVFEDQRGFFLESYNKRTYEKLGICDEFVQDNHARSIKNVVRGLHYQKNYPQGKLVRVLEGSVLDVIVDIRIGSPTFGEWFSCEISAENQKQIWIPGGLAHGYSVLSESADFFYKVTDYYHPEDEKGVRWNDSELNIEWQVLNPIVSDKDQKLPAFNEALNDFPSFKSNSF